MNDILKNLNSKQKEAVETLKGPLLILAGPGSGKTRVLTHRLAYLIKNNISPQNILAVTFTNKAADEMKQRVKKLLANKSSIPFIGTFHSFCLRILRKEIDPRPPKADGSPITKGDIGGHNRNFVIYDEEDQIKIIKQAMQELNIDKEQFQPKKVVNIISSLKSELIDSSIYEKSAQEYFEKTISKIYSLYQKTLKKNNALDFNDLIMFCVQIFEKFPEILKKYQEKFKYILVDEYQDTDPAQYCLIKLLSRKYKNICVVGDDAQSIYSFRNADFRNILNFEKDYPKAKIITLDQNYRSTQNILDAASKVISKNVYQKPKNLWTQNSAGPLISIIEVGSEKAEAELIVEKIMEFSEQGFKLNDFTVFYRTNAQSRALEETLIRHDIPYKLVGAVKFYQRKEIKDIISYLKFIATNDLISLERIINIPSKKIGKEIINNIKDSKKSLLEKSLSELLKFILKKNMEIILFGKIFQKTNLAGKTLKN